MDVFSAVEGAEPFSDPLQEALVVPEPDRCSDHIGVLRDARGYDSR